MFFLLYELQLFATPKNIFQIHFSFSGKYHLIFPNKIDEKSNKNKKIPVGI
jgi:hypothetical protein